LRHKFLSFRRGLIGESEEFELFSLKKLVALRLKSLPHRIFRQQELAEMRQQQRQVG
jgi:hypothetical protein